MFQSYRKISKSPDYVSVMSFYAELFLDMEKKIGHYKLHKKIMISAPNFLSFIIYIDCTFLLVLLKDKPFFLRLIGWIYVRKIFS